MVKLKNPWHMFGIIALTLGGVFGAASIIIFLSSNNQISELTNAFCVNGVVWVALGSIFILYYKWIHAKQRRLKRDGFIYDAKIESLRISPFIRIGGYITVFAECTYKNQEGKICLIKSRLFLQNCPKDDLKAVVYVNKNNPMDYSVEIFAELKSNTSYDYDYR